MIDLLTSRSISTRFCVELWADSPTRSGLHQDNKKYLEENARDPCFDEENTFKVHAEAFMKR